MDVKHGFSAERLERLEARLEEHIAAGRLPGCAISIRRRGHRVFGFHGGWADIEVDTPIASDTIYRIHSLSKPIMSVAFMTLVEEGRVALDDPVTRYLPEWTDMAADMRIVDLLRHTAGLTYHFQNRTPIDRAYREQGIDPTNREGDLPAMIAALGNIPLQFAPGEAWNYSLATDVIGHIAERITGQDVASLLAGRVLDPLGMAETGFAVAPDKASRLSSLYAWRDGAALRVEAGLQSEWLREPRLFSAGGGMVSTLENYDRFAQMLLNGGRSGDAVLLSPSTVRLMTSNHLPGGGDLHGLSVSMFSETSYRGIGFGLGFGVTIDPVRSLMPGSPGDFFWGGASGVFALVDPVREITLVFMMQLMGADAQAIRRELRTLLHASLVDEG